ncbi:MAG TPA: ATP-dependent helicase HrpB [Thermoflexales bacterium]|nr:ATP-dependent helicase HrpB [Thermoflexales bacterium]
MEPLPIYAALPELRAVLRQNTTALLTAPPGAGKSTIAPLELLNEHWLGKGRILMLEPRRLAARAVAARMAHLYGDALGQTVGYRVRFENRVSAITRVEVLTEGILTRRLQNDPALEGVGLVIFDEFHERSLHADLALALCRDAQTALRPDLRILIMSATLDAGGLSAALEDAPVVRAQGRQYPVELRYAERDFDAPLPVALASAVSALLKDGNVGDVDTHNFTSLPVGDILAFLPGAGEIKRAADILTERHPDVLICQLYGDLPLDAQQAAILPDPAGRRRVVLATSIAETSLTIEGVRVVVDGGYARGPRFDPRTGLTRLETARVTLDAADQRAGRAGRLAPGMCYRLWTPQIQRQLNPIRKPEIAEADLAPLRLELAQWGANDAAALRWVTPPPAGALAQATELLRMLDALDDEDRITPRGRRMLDWGAHPRLAHMLLEAHTMGAQAAALAADLAALVEERDPLGREAGADITARVEALRHNARGFARIERMAAQWRSQMRVGAHKAAPDHFLAGKLLALAYPDRIAQRRGNTHRYRLANGRGVALPEHDPLQTNEWIVAADVDGGAQAEGRIFLAAPLDAADLLPLAREREVVGWDDRAGALVAQREQRIGELILSAKALPAPPLAQRVAVLCDVARKEGMALLNWTDEARQWQARAQSLRVWRGDPWPDVSDDALLANAENWLGPWLDRATKRTDFARLDVLEMLRPLLAWPLPGQMESFAPEHIVVPSGSAIRLRYSVDGSPPVLAVKLQEMFGLADTPTVNEGRTRALLHLLSPAQRPIQVTQDLASFWRNTYPEVRKELRGRYIKHPWPEDPWNAVPTRRTAKASGH